MESSRNRFMARSGIRDDIFGKVVPFQGKFLPLFKFDILFIVCFWYSFIVFFFFFNFSKWYCFDYKASGHLLKLCELK